MIECRDVTKFVAGNALLRGVSFQAEEGQLLGILGPNGAGKTTTMRIISTFLAPTSGQVHVGGYDAGSNSDKIRAIVGVLPESPPLYDELRVTKYISFFGCLRNLEGKRLVSAVDEVIDRCRLGVVKNAPCGTLSKGFRQKVALAAAIIGEPKILLLDEPTSGLDPREIIEIRALIRELKEGRTILFSSHILSEVSEICDRVVFFARGRTVLEGSVSELTQDKSLETVFLQALEVEE
jgi:ABC-2 type transport system ATP-binding protein